MASQLRPTRLAVTDRFPMLGFTIRTDSAPRVAEIVIATDPAHFTNREGRSPSTFYNSREHGPLSVPRNEAVYVVPPEVLSRFIAADRLWFGLATASAPAANDWTVDALPTASSPYISLSGLSDRSMRRVRLYPPRTRAGTYGGQGPAPLLEWAGDRAQPGMTPAPSASLPTAAAPGNGATPAAPAPAPADVPYDDGFGPLPPLAAEKPAAAPATGSVAPPPGSAAQSLAGVRAFEVDPETMGIEQPILDEAVQPQAMALGNRPRALTAAEYSGVTRIMPSPAYNNGRNGQTIDRIVIHITGAPQSPYIGSWFAREEANTSAHYMVDQNGAIIQFVREQDTAWHAMGANRRSIGIEHVAIQQGGARYPRRDGTVQTFPYTPPTDVEYRASAELVAHLCRKYGLTPDRTTIIGHREADPSTDHSVCPDGAWDWDAYMALVASCYSALQPAAQAMSGGYTVSSERHRESPPHVRLLSTLERTALELAIGQIPYSSVLDAARAAAAPLGLSIAIGPSIGGSLRAGGVSAGCGIIFAPNGDIGLYGQVEFDVGRILPSANAVLQVTVLKGGIEAFSGATMVAGVSGGEFGQVGISALFDTTGEFMGVTVQGGIGVGIGNAVAVYLGVQRSVATPLVPAQALAVANVVAMDAGAISISPEQHAIPSPRVDTYSQLRSIAIQALLAINPALTPMVIMARAAAEAGGVAVGIGPQVSAGLLAGAGLGAGIIFAPGNVMGVYGQVEINEGFIAGIGANLQITVVRGGVEAFSGISYGASISGGEGITAGATALFDANRQFQGVSVSVGIGASLSPVDIYVGVQRAVSTQLGMAMAADPSLASALSGGETVEVKYRMFIPSPVIAGPISGIPYLGTDYGGDGRGFSYSGGTSRGEITATVTLNPDGGLSNLRTVNRHWGESTAYDPANTFNVEGKPDWWKDKQHGTTPTERGTCPVNDDNLKIYLGAPGTTRNVLTYTSNSSVLSIYAAGTNPLATGAPAIDADVSVFLRNGANGVEAMIVGEHDGFPAHELYINGQRVHHYDPVAAGNGPTALFPPCDQSVSTGWIPIGSTASVAQALSGEIPLDPGVGGMSIGTAALEVGDVIVTTTNQPVSRAIRAGSGSEVSHVMLYVGQGEQVIEAINEGVVMRPLEQALAESHLAVAFRVQGLDPVTGQRVAESAVRHVGQPFNHLGIVRNALFRMHATACRFLPNGAAQRCREFVGRVDLGPGANDRFFCSQLVLQCFADVGHPLTAAPPHWASPGDIAELRLSDGVLAYVGHLKAPIPRQGFFGVSLGTIRDARGLSAGLAADDWSINWDEVEQIAQPSDMSCWATAAAMLVGWRDLMCVSPEMLANCHGLTSSLTGGLAPGDKRAFADALGLVVHPNACYTAEGFRDILEANGPVWVTAKVPFVHAIVVTGMYRENGRYYVRVTDPLDRVIGTPGAPGARSDPPTHNTGSRYIMTYEAFAQEFEAAGDIDRIQLLHTGGAHGHTINRGSARADGYAQALDLMQPPARSGAGDDSLGFGTSLTNTSLDKPGRRYELAQLSGMVTPVNGLAGGAGVPALPGERVVLDDWPFIPGPSGRTQAGIAIDWQYQGGAVGNVVITPIEGQTLDGWDARVRAEIRPGESTMDRVQLRVRVTTIFSRPGVEDQVAVTEVELNGDGRQQTRHGADQGPVAPAAPRAPAIPDRPSSPPRLQLETA